MIVFSVVRSTRFKISTTAFTPPAEVKSCVTSEDNLRSKTFSTSRMISGDVRSIVAMRFVTSACLSGGKDPMRIAA